MTPIAAQLSQFESLVKQNKIDNTNIQQAFFFFESGSNDLLQYYLSFGTSNVTEEELVKAMVMGVEDWVMQTYKLGARRFSLFGVGPVGCVPARVILGDTSANGCNEDVNQLAQNFNMGLEAIAKDMPKKYPGAVGVYGATYDILITFLSFPKHHGKIIILILVRFSWSFH